MKTQTSSSGLSAAASLAKNSTSPLQATPIDVGPVLREAFWSKLDTAVLTSATLAVGRRAFDYIRSRLGVDHGARCGSVFALRLPEPGAILCSAPISRIRAPRSFP
jgi:Rad3-related DNA helicase